jgi:hypothetical protein
MRTGTVNTQKQLATNTAKLWKNKSN